MLTQNNLKAPSINYEFEKSDVYISTFFNDDKKFNLTSKKLTMA